jgi:hypothetical protein
MMRSLKVPDSKWIHPLNVRSVWTARWEIPNLSIPRLLLTIVFCLLAISNALFYSFEGLLGRAGVLILTLFVTAAVAIFTWRNTASIGNKATLSFMTAAICFAAALALCVLGGEGRFFYANLDWQVRDPLYHDIVTHSWPFKYAVPESFLVLRAPLGMYLLPALFAKFFGNSFENGALLLQNTILLGSLFSLVTCLFKKDRQLLALLVFIFFSGMEIVGYSINVVLGHRGWHPDHVEPWSWLFQYSSVITTIFWTPHHAVPGIAAGALYVMWRREMIPASVFLALVPLLGFWSPFALLGIIPFASYVVICSVRKGIRIGDLLTAPAATGILCLLPYIYLRSATSGVRWTLGFAPSVASTPVHGAVLIYILFIALQVLPFIVILFWKRKDDIGLPSLFILTACLLVIPFIHLGQGIDFCMRASIPALTLLALETIELLFLLYHEKPFRNTPLIAALTFVLCLGSATGILEIKRAVTQRPVTATGCNFVDGWNASEFRQVSYTTYLAQEAAMPRVFRKTNASVINTGFHGPCWQGNWYIPHN